MKPIIACIAMAVLPMSAQSSTDLARQWGQEANRLSAQTSDMITTMNLGQSLEISDAYALDVYRFGRTSADLARWIDGANGPSDLGCLFRGIAVESEAQLMALETADTAPPETESLHRLAALFSDAEIMAVAAQRPRLTARTNARQGCSSCAAKFRR